MTTPRILLPILIGALMTVSACSAVTTDNETDPGSSDGSEFTTTFTRIAETGYIDMRLDFENPTSDAVTLDGHLVARDASGAVLPEVQVTTAFGTESGRAVVFPGVRRLRATRRPRGTAGPRDHVGERRRHRCRRHARDEIRRAEVPRWTGPRA